MSDKLANSIHYKPIYYHPISIIKNDNVLPMYNLSFIILDGNSEAYTLQTFKTFINDLGGIIGVVRMNCSGYFKNENIAGTTSILARVNGSNWQIILGNEVREAAAQESSFEDLLGTDGTIEFVDGVNLIN